MALLQIAEPGQTAAPHQARLAGGGELIQAKAKKARHDRQLLRGPSDLSSKLPAHHRLSDPEVLTEAFAGHSALEEQLVNGHP